MTKKIISVRQLQNIQTNDIIIHKTQHNTEEKFQICKIDKSTVAAVRTDGETHLKIFPIEHLIGNNWWLEKDLIL